MSTRPTEHPLPALSRRAFLAGAAATIVGVALPACSKAPTTDAPATATSATTRPVVYDRPATTADASAATGPQAVSHSTATLLMVGDILVHQGVWKSGEHPDGSRSYDHIYAHVTTDAQAADVAMLNQETILGGTELGLEGFPNFNSPQEIGDAEVAAGFDVALAATNHAADQGMEGIRAELDFWRARHPNVRCIGIQDSQEAYDQVDIIDSNGIKVAVLNHTFSLNGLPMPAPYAVRMLEEDKFAHDYELARDQGADVVVEVPHWGTEYAHEADSYQRRWANIFLDYGVDVVIGSHAHVIQPVDVLERDDGHRMLVYWSLGNFTSFQLEKPRMVGGMAKVTLSLDTLADGSRSAGVTGWSLEPVVTHRAEGTDFSTYKLVDYPDELAQANGIRHLPGCADFSRAWIDDHCAQVLGPNYDRGACILKGGAL